MTYQRSYMARLNCIHENPARHGVVDHGSNWAFGSAAWFERTAPESLVRTVHGFRADTLKVYDDFD